MTKSKKDPLIRSLPYAARKETGLWSPSGSNPGRKTCEILREGRASVFLRPFCRDFTPPYPRPHALGMHRSHSGLPCQSSCHGRVCTAAASWIGTRRVSGRHGAARYDRPPLPCAHTWRTAAWHAGTSLIPSATCFRIRVLTLIGQAQDGGSCAYRSISGRIPPAPDIRDAGTRSLVFLASYLLTEQQVLHTYLQHPSSGDSRIRSSTQRSTHKSVSYKKSNGCAELC